VKAVDVPVTVKMRMGWDHDSLNAPELARIAEDLGAKMITVHGRTRNQMYKGERRLGVRPHREGSGHAARHRQWRHLFH
jgi:tRNA-dihydrouridine synthase B